MNAIILSAVMGVLLMFSGVLFSQKSLAKTLAVAGGALLVIANLFDIAGKQWISIDTKGMLSADQFGLTFYLFLCAVTTIYWLLSGKDIEAVGNHKAEYYALQFFILCGIGLLSTFQSTLMLFLGIEIVSIPLYILTGSDKRNLKSNEAALKYFLMGSFSTGILLMGIALMYGASPDGSFALKTMFQADKMQPMLMAGIVLVFVSMAFKVSAAPFHFWTPDVYDGAPTVFTGFMASIVKAAFFFGFLRIFDVPSVAFTQQWQIMVAIVIVLTLLIGNITAVFQQSVKRMLAYSSIAQAGFMLFALFAQNDLGKQGLLLYGVAYSLATIAIFAVLVRMDDFTFDGFNGLGKQEPVLAFAVTIGLLSLAGIPLTAGFFGKYYMLAAAVKNGSHLWLVIFGVLMAAISVFYYFRVIQAMYFKTGDVVLQPVSSTFKGLLLGVALLLILLGIFPQLLLTFGYDL